MHKIKLERNKSKTWNIYLPLVSAPSTELDAGNADKFLQKWQKELEDALNDVAASRKKIANSK